MSVFGLILAALNAVCGCCQLGLWLNGRKSVNVAIMALNFTASLLLIAVRA